MVAALDTLGLSILVLDFVLLKNVDRRISHVPSTENSSSAAMGNLPGPALVEGDRVTVLRNGRDPRCSRRSGRSGALAKGRSRWGDLIDAGVEVPEYPPTMDHARIMIADGAWIWVG